MLWGKFNCHFKGVWIFVDDGGIGIGEIEGVLDGEAIGDYFYGEGIF